MNTLFIAQVAVTVALILWMALAPPRSASGFFIQFAARAVCLWAAALLGIWLVAPWWAPWGFGAGLLAAAGLALRQRRLFASPLPATQGCVGRCSRVCGTRLHIGVRHRHRMAQPDRSTAGREPGVPAGNRPLPRRQWRQRLQRECPPGDARASEPRFREWRGQSYGVDLVQLDGLRLRAKGLQPADPRSYRIYGARVLATCAGRVVLAADGLPDMQIPEMYREHMAGNPVLLRRTEADVLLGHLHLGSVQVRVGDAVATGVWLGAVGNSGNTGEPHLHVHAQRPGPASAPIGGDPLPITFNGRFPVRGDRIGSP